MRVLLNIGSHLTVEFCGFMGAIANEKRREPFEDSRLLYV